MKLQLNEKTLNAYMQRAINEEIDELFGSRVRKQSQRMITGKGWGNQRRDSTNGWGAAANSDISATDAESDTPQTLVGMITKMERGLQTIEQTAGINSPAGNLAATVTGARGVKGSLLAAINALTQIANRLNKVERMSGSNAIMEGITETNDYVAYDPDAYSYLNKPKVQKVVTTPTYNYTSTAPKVPSSTQATTTSHGYSVPRQGTSSVSTTAGNAGAKAAADAKDVAGTVTNAGAKAAADAGNAGKKAGFWGKRLQNTKTGLKTAKQGLKMMARPGSAARAINAGTKLSNVGKAGAFMRGGVTTAKGLAQASQWPLLLFSIADEAARQAAQGRQRNIVRTYNAAAVLARRMGNILQDISDQTGGGQEQEVVTEINVSRGKRSFGSIEQGMQALSQEMRRIGGATQGSTINGQDRVFNIPQGIDLNTPEGVKAFQEWVNTIQDANGNALITDNEDQPLVPDGKWGPKTNAVYDKIAQMIRQSGPVNEGLVTERRDIETALANLERVAGATGSGGNAYSSISAMSGGADASRLQNAQNIKNIIRTYPPVLNQYLNVLADAGAEVSGIQPLNVDTRPHRNYSIKELKAIDNRIQELLQIARNTQTPEGEEGEQQGGNLIIRGTLPPKPVRRQNPNPNPTPAPPELPELEIPEIEDEPLEIEDEPLEIEDDFMNLDSTMPEVPFMANPYTLESYGIIPNDKTGRITKRELKDKIRNAMAQGKLTPERAQELIRQVRQDYRNGVSQRYTNPDGTTVDTTDNARRATKRANRQATRETNRANRQAMRDANQAPEYISESRVRRKKLNENQFKRLVKQIIRESLR